MNFNKFIIPICLLSILTACGSKGYAGTYVFQLGKDKDTHMGITLNLTKELYNANEPDRGNKFVLSMDMSSKASDTSMFSILDEFNPIEGSYKVDKDSKVYDSPSLKLGISLLGEYDIPNEIMDYLFVAGISDKAATFYIPVSLQDLTFQLYWYGFDFSIEKYIADESEDIVFPSQEGSHPLGSHPTQEEIDQINTHYKDDHGGIAFRDYHVLKLGLTKE